MFPPFSASKLLLENACYFPGMTLTASPHVARAAPCPTAPPGPLPPQRSLRGASGAPAEEKRRLTAS